MKDLTKYLEVIKVVFIVFRKIKEILQGTDRSKTNGGPNEVQKKDANEEI